MNIGISKNVIRTNVRSVAIYGCETWATDGAEKRSQVVF